MTTEADRLTEQVVALKLLLQKWRFVQHPFGCPCKLCKETALAIPELPYYPDQNE
jgi:hypothetical protein